MFACSLFLFCISCLFSLFSLFVVCGWCCLSCVLLFCVHVASVSVIRLFVFFLMCVFPVWVCLFVLVVRFLSLMVVSSCRFCCLSLGVCHVVVRVCCFVFSCARFVVLSFLLCVGGVVCLVCVVVRRPCCFRVCDSLVCLLLNVCVYTFGFVCLYLVFVSFLLTVLSSCRLLFCSLVFVMLLFVLVVLCFLVC